MLNETWQLWQSLQRANITPEAQHPLIKSLPKTEKHLLRVRLDSLGNVTAVEDIADSQREGIKRIVQTSDGSFPVVKINQPLLSIRAKSPVWRLIKRMPKGQHNSRKLRLLEICVRTYPSRKWNETGHSWTQSIDKADILEKGLTNVGTAAGIVLLSQRFLTATANHDDILISSLATLAFKSIQQGNLTNLDTVKELLIGKGKEGTGKDKKISVLLVLDLDQSANMSVYAPQVWRCVAETLPMNLSDRIRKHVHRAEGCAFGGDGALLAGPFPQVKLPVLHAYFPLVSMASDDSKAKCNKRYGLTEYVIVPVAEQVAMRMQDALTWIVGPKHKDQTWRGVANGRFIRRNGKTYEQQDLLLAFVEDKPDVDANTSKYIAEDRNVSEATFEVDAKSIADAFNADPQVRPKSRLRLFLIRKASDGQAKVVFTESPTVEQALNAAEQWVYTVKNNTPHIRLWLPEETRNKKKLKAGEGQPLPPYPDQVVRLLSYKWVQDGSSPKGSGGKARKPYHEVIGPSIAEVLSLMLRIEDKWEPAAQRMLELLIQRLTPLLIGVFGAKNAYGPRINHNMHEPLFDYPRSSRETALRAVAVTAILLDALDLRKETIMKNAPFQIGQVIALADTLHKDYCTVVRKGQLPNTLVGTSLMRRAMDNPASAVADLGERILEYVRWAKTADAPQGVDMKEQRIAVNEARKKLRQYQPLALALGSIELPTDLTDADKAQLLLGFLASPPEEA